MPSADTPSLSPPQAVGGEMGERVRRHDWSNTSLGPMEQWPLSLRTLVRMVLTSRFPMVLMWGPELSVLYNDAFRPSLGDGGKHPGVLGQPGEVAWAESWPVVGQMIRGVLRGGPATFVKDQRVPLERNGVLDYSFWTHGYSPLTDDDGAVAGVLSTALETTEDAEHCEYFSEPAVQP